VEPKIIPVTSGEVLEFSDWAAVIKVSAEATDGTLTVIEGGIGGDEGTRTPDPCDANAVLSQLSYIPRAGRVYQRP
jgi:hypothetical protein